MPANEQRGKLSPDAVYQQIHENIRTTDDISFKLMSLVPLITGAAISLLAKSSIPWGVKCFISAFAAIVVFGIFRWELRNIQLCNWQRVRAEGMDNAHLPGAPELRYVPRKKTKTRSFGKTQAEITIYLAVILAWLLLPGVDGWWRLEGTPGRWVGVAASLAFGVGLAAWIVRSSPPFGSLRPQITPVINEETTAALTFPRHPYSTVYLHPIRASEHLLGNQGAIAGLSDAIGRMVSVSDIVSLSDDVTAMFSKAGLPKDKEKVVLQSDLGDPFAKALVLRAALAASGRLKTDIRAARPEDFVLARGPGRITYLDRNSQNAMHLRAYVSEEVAEEVLAEHARRLRIRRTDDNHPEYYPVIAQTPTGIAVALCGRAELNHSNASGWIGEAECRIFGIKICDWARWTLLTPIHAWYQLPARLG
jgi:hypothetical protein